MGKIINFLEMPRVCKPIGRDRVHISAGSGAMSEDKWRAWFAQIYAESLRIEARRGTFSTADGLARAQHLLAECPSRLLLKRTCGLSTNVAAALMTSRCTTLDQIARVGFMVHLINQAIV
jgi:hypothetical protein